MLLEASVPSTSVAEVSSASWLSVAGGCVRLRPSLFGLPMRPPRVAGPPRVELGGSTEAAVVLLLLLSLLLLRVAVRLGRVAVGSDCGGDAGTPDSCS